MIENKNSGSNNVSQIQGRLSEDQWNRLSKKQRRQEVVRIRQLIQDSKKAVHNVLDYVRSEIGG